MATKLSVLNDALRLLGDARLATLTDDTEARYELDASWDRSVNVVFAASFWRFAFTTETLTHNGALAALPGFSYRFALPALPYRLHSVFIQSGGRDLPIDCRQEGAVLHANKETGVVIRYVDDAAAADLTKWPEVFARAVAAYLAFDLAGRISQDPQAPQAAFDLWQRYLGEAQAAEAVPADPWLLPQLSGDFNAAARHILKQGFWRFAMRSASITQTPGTPSRGFTYVFDMPSDWIKTQSLFRISDNREVPFDVREHGTKWSADVDSLTVRYLSTDGLDATLWPEEFIQVVAAHLAERAPVRNEKGEAQPAGWVQLLQAALPQLADPVSPWLAKQLDGSFASASRNILEQAFWSFALKTGTPGSGGTAVAGFTNSYAKPADWLRTHAIFKVSGAREVPVDVREQGGFWSANEAVTVRYLSNEYLDATTWPEDFSRLVASYLGIEQATVVRGENGAEASAWPQYLERAAANMAVPESPWLAHQLSGAFRAASKAILEKAFWKFSTRSEARTNSVGTTAPGFAYSFSMPSDLLKVRAIFVVSGSRETPIDVREIGSRWSANVAGITVDYLSDAGMDAATWPEEFSEIVLAYLDQEAAEGAARWERLLLAAMPTLAVPESPWLGRQLDGSFRSASQKILEAGFWHFAMKSEVLAAQSGGSLAPLPGYAFSFAKPATWLRTQAFFRRAETREHPIDAREHGTRWSANYATPVVRYLSSDGLDPTLWPEPFTRTVGAYLGIDVGDGASVPVQRGEQVVTLWPKYLQEALAAEATAVSPWLAHQFEGRLLPAARDLLERGTWKFAIKTVELAAAVGTPSSGYDNSFARPADWIRTVQLYRDAGGEQDDIDYREEGGFFHADASPVVLRYLSSTLGLDTTAWPALFEEALLAALSLRRAADTPGTSGAALQALKGIADQALRDARAKDDARDRPRIDRFSRFVAGRQGFGASRRSREQGW